MAPFISTYATFEDEKFYNKHVYPKFGAQPLDFHYEKLHYGKVDRLQNAVYISSRDLELLQPLEPGKPELAVDFVAEAFSGLREHFEKALGLNRISRSGVFKNGLNAKKGWVSVQNLYRTHLENLYEAFTIFLINSGRNKKLKNYEDFLFFFREYVDTYAHAMPMTLTGFIKSKFCPRNISGLIIELEGGEFGEIDKKEEWINDINFNFYRNAALKYGFRVDKSAPWCLIANVASIEMQNLWFRTIPEWTAAEAAAGAAGKTKEGAQPFADEHSRFESKRGLIFEPGDASNLFELYYRKAHLKDVNILAKTLLETYNKFIGAYPIVKIYKPTSLKNVPKCGPITVETITRNKMLPSTWGALLIGGAVHDLVSLHFLCRIREEGLDIPDNKQAKILEKTTKLAKLDTSKSFWYINNEIKKYISLKVNPTYCQNYEICGEDVKNKDALRYNKYVKSFLF